MRPFTELIAPDWAEALADQSEHVAKMGCFLRDEIAHGRGYLPAGENILRAFTRPMREVKVLIVGQDPYPTPGHPIGLSFATDRSVHPLPPSLVNIYTELHADLGVPIPSHGDLSHWFDQGVLLLNRVLTVSPGKARSHKGKGWEQVTGAAIDALIERGGPLVAILWGNDARSLAPALKAGGVTTIESAHPSPLSAYRGFFGSRPFSRANAALIDRGATEIDWSIPE